MSITHRHILYVLFLVFLVASPNSVRAWHGPQAQEENSQNRPIGDTAIRAAALVLYSDLSDYPPTNRDLQLYAERTEPEIDRALAEPPNEAGLGDLVARFLGILNPTQMNTLEIKIRKKLEVEWTTEPKNKKYIALLLRLLRGKEIRRGLNSPALMNGEARYDKGLEEFDHAFTKSHEEEVKPHNQLFHKRLEEAQKGGAGALVFMKDYPTALAFGEKERRTNLVKPPDESVLTQGQIYSNQISTALSTPLADGSRVMSLIDDEGLPSNLNLGSDPKAFHEKMEKASAIIAGKWDKISVSPYVHPEGTPNFGERPAKPPEAPQTTQSNVRVYEKPPRHFSAEGGMSKSAVFLRDAETGEAGHVVSPAAIASDIESMKLDVNGKEYSIEKPFIKTQLGIPHSALWHWEAPVSEGLKAELIQQGADLSGVGHHLPIKSLSIKPVTYFGKLVENTQKKEVPLTQSEVAAKATIIRDCQGCHSNPKAEAYEHFQIPEDTNWVAFLRDADNRAAIKAAAVDSNSMPPPTNNRSAEALRRLQAARATMKKWLEEKIPTDAP